MHAAWASGHRLSVTEVTWNPTTGCTKVSEGCDNCYADVLSAAADSGRDLPSASSRSGHCGQPRRSVRRKDLAGAAGAAGRMEGAAPRLRQLDVGPLPQRHPRGFPERRFSRSCSMWTGTTYQVLTKRPSRAARFVRQNADLFGSGGLPPHIWIGTSTENQKTAYRIRHLQRVSGGGPVPELRASDRAAEPVQGAEFWGDSLGDRGR